MDMNSLMILVFVSKKKLMDPNLQIISCLFVTAICSNCTSPRVCVSPNECLCPDNRYTGESCDQRKLSISISVCREHMNSTYYIVYHFVSETVTVAQCGLTHSFPTMLITLAWFSHMHAAICTSCMMPRVCFEPEKCACPTGWTGETCSNGEHCVHCVWKFWRYM